jgi:hypothetical protein
MKSTSKRSIVQVKHPNSAARSTALVGTGLLLLATGFALAVLDE